jgi:phospholipid/cholesterol/gamma-HCH transport system ATP-binding protein
MEQSPLITVRDLSVRQGEYVVLHDVSFTVRRGDWFVIMGDSGSGKSTLLNAMIGIVEPPTGEVLYDEQSFTRATPDERRQIMQRFGVLFQFGALWSGLTLAENVALPLTELTHLGQQEIRELTDLKLALVELGRFRDFYPDEISSSMRKRAALARALALDPDILFLDEPSADLGPVEARHIDDLVAELRACMNTTVVSVTHDLASIFATATDGIYLDARLKTVTARGNPKLMRAHPPNVNVHAFLTRAVKPEAR